MWLQDRSPREESLNQILEDKELEMEQLCEEYECMQTLCNSNQREKQRMEQEISELIQANTGKDLELKDLSIKLNQSESEMRHYHEELVRSQQEISQLQQEAQDFESISNNAYAELNKLTDIVKSQEAQFGEYENLISSLRQSLREKDADLCDLKQEIQNIKTVSVESNAHQDEIQDRITQGENIELMQELKDVDEERLHHLEKLSVLEEQLQQKEMKISSLNQALASKIKESASFVNSVQKPTVPDTELELNKQKFIDGLKKRNSCLVYIDSYLLSILGMKTEGKV